MKHLAANKPDSLQELFETLNSARREGILDFNSSGGNKHDINYNVTPLALDL